MIESLFGWLRETSPSENSISPPLGRLTATPGSITHHKRGCSLWRVRHLESRRRWLRPCRERLAALGVQPPFQKSFQLSATQRDYTLSWGSSLQLKMNGAPVLAVSALNIDEYKEALPEPEARWDWEEPKTVFNPEEKPSGWEDEYQYYCWYQLSHKALTHCFTRVVAGKFIFICFPSNENHVSALLTTLPPYGVGVMIPMIPWTESDWSPDHLLIIPISTWNRAAAINRLHWDINRRAVNNRTSVISVTLKIVSCSWKIKM